MARDKNPSLDRTCIICRQKITSSLHVRHSDNLVGSGRRDVVQWKTLFSEAFCMMFGLPEDHPFTSVFVNGSNRKGQFCSTCYQDIANAHHIFWQLQNLEKKLERLQSVVLSRIRLNYDAIPVATVFARLGEEDIVKNFGKLKYDEIVKILFESKPAQEIKEAKESWPKPKYDMRWKLAQQTANKFSSCVSPIVVRQESVSKDLYGSVEPVVKTEVDEGDIAQESSSGAFDFMPPDTSRQSYDDDSFYDPNQSLDCDPDFVLSEQTSRRSKSRPKRIRKNMKITTLKEETSKSTHTYLCIKDPENCSRSYRSEKQLNAHVNSFHDDGLFICDLEGCKARFQTQGKLDKHNERIHEHRKKTTEICESCGIEVPRGDLKRHFYLRHLGVGKFSCERCSMDFNDHDELEKHGVLHEQSEYPFSCVVCLQLFTNSLDLKAHVSSNHLSSGLKCSVCGIMKPNDFLLQRHMKLHERTKRHICECGKGFASKGYLSYHKEHYHTNLGRKFPCSVCGKTFTHMKNVQRHMVTHQEEKPFKCNICSKTFNYSHLLKKHEEIHSGTKNYGCEICGKRFRQEQNLSQHMRSHKPKPDRLTAKKPNIRPKLKVQLEHEFIDDTETIPVILEVKGDAEVFKVEERNHSEVDTNTLEITQGTIITSHDESGQFEGVQHIEIHEQPGSTTTTTVVFVSADQNIHWIQ